jgi:agmatinase
MMKSIQLIGVPTDRNSSYLKGAANGPAKIRELLGSDMMNKSSESGFELGTDIAFDDAGDLKCGNEKEFEIIEDSVTNALQNGHIPMMLGGDHSITYPILKAIAAHHGAVDILHIDAHPDLYEDYNGNRFSHASPCARIMEDCLARRLVQVGIRTLNAHQRSQARRFGVEIISMREFDSASPPQLDGPLYISIDLDGLDPAYAPGVSHHEPGGLSVRQLIDLLWSLDVPIVGADIVEYNPLRDVYDMTAAIAVKLIKELAACVAGMQKTAT